MKTAQLLIFLFCSISIIAQPDQWESVGIGGGGALFSPSFNPHQSGELFVASDLSAMYQTQNLGEQWTIVPFWEISTSTNSRINFTDDPNIQYCITSNGFQFIPKKSINGGENWQTFAPAPIDFEAWNLFADPNNSERLLISSYSELYFSNDGGASFNVVYSAPDLYLGGAFWDGDNIYVGCRTGLLVSNDGGASFNISGELGDLPADFGLLSLAGAKEGNSVRLFCVARTNSSMWPGMQASEYWSDQDIFKMDIGSGNGWALANLGIPVDDFPFLIDMAQNDIDIVYTAGATGWPNFPLVYKSEDGGDNWSEVFKQVNNVNIATGWQCTGGDHNWWWGGNAMGFEVAQNDPNLAVITDFGFIHLTDDGGDNWRQAYVHPNTENSPGDIDNEHQEYIGVGLEQTSCWWVHWTHSGPMMVGFSDITGIRSTNAPYRWSFDYEGNDWNSTYQIIEDKENEILYAAVSDIHDMYQSTRLRDNPLDDGQGSILFSNDAGKTWEVLHDFGHPVIYLALHPTNPSILYASVIDSQEGDIYVTEDLHNGAFSSWARLASPPRTEGHPYNIHVLEDGTLISTYSGRIDDSWSFTESSGVFVSTDGGNSWEDRSDPKMTRWTKDLRISPTSGDWFVGVFSHWGAFPNEVGGLYRSQDQGASWEVLGDFYRVESCLEWYGNMYVTTETEGLWFTHNVDVPNPDFQLLEEFPFAHPTRVFMNPYAIDKNDFWITSFGSGVWFGYDFSDNTTSIEEAPFEISVFPNPSLEFVSLYFEEAISEAEIKVFDVEGKLLLKDYIQEFSKEKMINLSSLNSGIYFLNVESEEGIWMEKFVKE